MLRKITQLRPLLSSRSYLAPGTSKVILEEESPALAGYKASLNPSKIYLGSQTYKNDLGRPSILNVVKKVEADICRAQLDKEYGAIIGDSNLIKHSKLLVFGAEPQLDKITTMQVLGLSGAMNVGFMFASDWLPKSKIYLPEPLVSAHERIALRATVPKCYTYPYYNPSTKALDIPKTADFLRKIDDASIVVLHASSHNPTGLEPTEGEWDTILEICKEKHHLPFMLLPYQGLVTGNLVEDAHTVRKFVKSGLQVMVAQSYSSTMGLYGERAGALHVVCLDSDTSMKVASQLKIQIRRFYSTPPLHSARIVGRVLQNPQYFEEWKGELKEIYNRLREVRNGLKDRLVSMKTPGNWNHLVKQVGPHSALGLNENEAKKLADNFGVYTEGGFANLAGINSRNIDYVAESIHKVLTQ